MGQAASKANAVVAAMNAEPGSVEAQRTGCSELEQCAKSWHGHGTSAAGAQAIVDAGGVTAVVAAIRQHAADTDVQRYGCVVLGRLAASGDVTGDAARAQAVVDGG